MALQTDDWDIRKSWFYIEVGGNGDYYLVTAELDREGFIRKQQVRVTTSGSRYPPAIMLAVANLYRTLNNFNLNSEELKRDLEFKAHEAPNLERSVATMSNQGKPS